MKRATEILQASIGALPRLGILLCSFVLLLPQEFWVASHAANPMENSWYHVLAWAFLNKLHFGSEIVFTYGPLGFLTNRLPYPGLRAFYLSSDLLLYGALFLVHYRVFARSSSLWEAAVCLLVVLPLALSGVMRDLALVFSALAFFFSCSFLRTMSWADLVGAALYSTLAFLIKLNVGLIALAVAAGLVGYRLLAESRFIRKPLQSESDSEKHGTASTLSGMALVFAGVVLLSLLSLPLSVGGYLRTPLEFLSAYGEVMQLPSSGFEHIQFRGRLLILALATTLAVQLFRLVFRRALLSSFLAALACSAFLFTLYKQSFIRADEWHVFSIFNFAPLYLGALTFSLPRDTGVLWRPVLFLSILFSFAQNSALYTPAWIASRLSSFPSYLTDARDIPAADPVPEAVELPAAFLQTIANASVDLLPGEASIALRNRLLYQPRPIFQSYAAFTPFLDRMNASFYNSARAPQFLIYEYDCIDDRYCFGEELQTKLAILERFEPVLRVERMLLLKQDPERRKNVKRTTIASGILRSGRWLRIPVVTGPFVVKMKLADSGTLAFFRRLLSGAPSLELQMLLDDGTKKVFRTASPLLASGVVADPFIPSIDSAESFFAGKFTKLQRVVSLRVVFLGKDASPDFRFELERLDLSRRD